MDKEVAAIASAYDALKDLNEKEFSRALSWLSARLLSDANKKPKPSSDDRTLPGPQQVKA